MSIKIFDGKINGWRKVGVPFAANTRVLDIENNFENEEKNVESCLKELKQNFKDLKDDVEYIYENGTIGGGGGGGGTGSVPVITLRDGDKKYVVNSDETIDIYFYFSSPNPGNGIAYLTCMNETTEIVVTKGPEYKWTVGPFPRGTYTLTIRAEDRQGLPTDPVFISVTSGALEIECDFDDSQEFSLEDVIEIPYKIISDTSDPVTVDLKFNNDPVKTVQGNIGSNTWVIGKLPFMGASKASIVARNSKYTSNVVNLTLVAADSETLSVSTTFTDEVVSMGSRPIIPYRISKLNEFSFYVDYYVDGEKQATIETREKVNYWDISPYLEVGDKVFKIVARTTDGLHEAFVEIPLTVVESDFTPEKEVTSGLIAKFDTSRKTNQDSDRDEWVSNVDNRRIVCNLYNFNYATNGWIKDEETGFTELKFNGKTYAEIDFSPFANGIKASGFTFDILYKIKNIGNVDAKVLHCRNIFTPYQGLEIGIEQAILNNRNNEAVTSLFGEDIWTRQTFVINRSDSRVYIYTNGVLSGYTDTSKGSMDEFAFAGKILLGASYTKMTVDGEGSSPENFASCSIRNIRIYDRSLSASEVLRNHISDMSYKDQEKVLELNSENSIGAPKGMPYINLKGLFDGIETDGAERDGEFEYFDPFDASKGLTKQCKFSVQGTSSKEYVIKNYTIKLYNGSTPHVTWAPKDDWLPEYRWTLKANYMDQSQANNIGTNKFIHDFNKAENRTYPSQIANPKCRSNVDGFPVAVLINDKFDGIYTLNIDRYAPHNYGFVTSWNENGTPNNHPTAVSYEISANSTNGAGAFKDDSWDSIKSEFKHRYNYRGEEGSVTMKEGSATVLTEGMHTELQDLISWVKNADDDEFFKELKDHFSVPHLIDYYLIAYVLGMADNLGKNMVLSTWGPEKAADGSTVTIWYPSFYDCDTILGISNNGQITHGPGMDMTKLDGSEGDYMTSNSELWVKLRRNFEKEIRQRYKDLRYGRLVNDQREPGLFSLENIMKYYDGVINQIGQKFYNMDAERKFLVKSAADWKWMCSGTRRDRTEKWLRERFIYMDSVFEAQEFTDSSAVLRTNVMKNVTLRLKTYSPQIIKVAFSDRTTDIKYVYVDKDKWYDVSGRLDATDNNLTIYGAYNLMDIDGVTSMNVSFVNIAKASKLTSIDFSGSTHIKQIGLGANTYLQTIKCYNCPNLGSVESAATLDLENCVNLRYLDCHNTKLGGIKFSKKGGVLDFVDVSNTQITSFELKSQEYIESLDLSSCTELATFVVDDCNRLKVIQMPDTKLETFKVLSCANVTDIDISNTKFLTIFDIQGCPNLRVLKMANVSNKNITDLNLRNALNIEELNISGSTSIECITFGKHVVDGQIQNYNGIKKLTCNNSAIKTIRWGNDEPTEVLDLSPFTLQALNFSGCKSLKEITGLNISGTSAADMFNNCSNLVAVRGNMNISGSISGAFYQCSNLRTFPTINMANVTSLSSTFHGCRYMTLNLCVSLLKGASSKLTSLYKAFLGCYKAEDDGTVSGIVGMLPADIFSKCSGVTDASYVFSGCSGIDGYLPYNLLFAMTSVKDLYGAFNGCKIRGSEKDGVQTGRIHVDFFSRNGNLESVRYLFQNQLFTLTPEEGLFANNNNLKSCDRLFDGCSQMQGQIPENLFRYKNELTSVLGCFAGCAKITGPIPRNIFRHTYGNAKSKLESVAHFFQNTSVSGPIPEYVNSSQKGLLDDLVSLKTAHSLFSGCTGITGQIPANLLKDNNALTRTDYMFSGCSGITGSIPPNLFKGKTNMLQVEGMFQGCSELSGGIPKGFLDDCTNINNISYLFSGCKKITGQIPKRVSEFTPDNEVNSLLNGIEDELFEDGTIKRKIKKEILDGSEVWELDSVTTTHIIAYAEFSDMKNILNELAYIECLDSSFAVNPSESQLQSANKAIWGTLNNRNIFIKMPISLIGGSTLSHLKSYLLNNNVTIMYPLEFYKMIAPGTMIETVLEKGIFDNLINIREAREVFKNCTSLNSEIPETLLINCSSVADITGMFENCFYLSGRIPPDLLINCLSLRYANNMFRNCCSLYDNQISEEQPYAIHPNFFRSCYNLESVSGFLNMWNDKATLPYPAKLAGEIPGELFENCSKLTSADSFLNSCSKITGTLQNNLFENSPNLQNVNTTFYATGITEIAPNFLRKNIKIKYMNATFKSCSSLRGLAPEYWESSHPINPSDTRECFLGCTGLTNFNDIDPNWK